MRFLGLSNNDALRLHDAALVTVPHGNGDRYGETGCNLKRRPGAVLLDQEPDVRVGDGSDPRQLQAVARLLERVLGGADVGMIGQGAGERVLVVEQGDGDVDPAGYLGRRHAGQAHRGGELLPGGDAGVSRLDQSGGRLNGQRSQVHRLIESGDTSPDYLLYLKFVDRVGELYHGPVDAHGLRGDQQGEIGAAHARGQVGLCPEQGQFGVAQVHRGDGALELELVGDDDLLLDEPALVAGSPGGAHRIAFVTHGRIGRQAGLDGGALHLLDARRGLANERAVGCRQLLEIGQRQGPAFGSWHVRRFCAHFRQGRQQPLDRPAPLVLSLLPLLALLAQLRQLDLRQWTAGEQLRRDRRANQLVLIFWFLRGFCCRWCLAGRGRRQRMVDRLEVPRLGGEVADGGIHVLHDWMETADQAKQPGDRHPLHGSTNHGSLPPGRRRPQARVCRLSVVSAMRVGQVESNFPITRRKITGQRAQTRQSHGGSSWPAT